MEIDNCSWKFQFQCPRSWHALRTTSDPNVRACDSCLENVYLCKDEAEVVTQAGKGRCVALAYYRQAGTLGKVIEKEDFSGSVAALIKLRNSCSFGSSLAAKFVGKSVLEIEIPELAQIPGERRQVILAAAYDSACLKCDRLGHVVDCVAAVCAIALSVSLAVRFRCGEPASMAFLVITFVVSVLLGARLLRWKISRYLWAVVYEKATSEGAKPDHAEAPTSGPRA